MKWCRFLLLYTIHLSVVAQPLRIVTEEFPPYQSKQNGLHGWSVQLVEQIMETAGLTYHIDVEPWARAYKDALDDPQVLIFSLLRTPEREQQFHWLVPLCPMQISFYRAKHRQDVVMHSLATARNYVVGVENGHANIGFLHDHGFQEGRNLVIVGPNHQLIQMLQAGRIDLMLASDLYIHNLPNHGADLTKVLTAHALENYLYLAARADIDPKLAAKIKSAWQQVRAEAQPKCQNLSVPPF